MVVHRAWLVLSFLGAASWADAEPCTPTIQGSELTSRWQRALDALRDEIATRSDIERCVTITLRLAPDHHHASLAVALDDRRAVRTLTDPADLRTTLLALLLEPQPTSPVGGPPPVIAPVHADIPPPPLAVRAHTTVTRDTSSPMALTIGIAIGALYTDGGAHPSVAAALHESRGPWSIGVFGRLASSGSSAMSVGGTTSRELGADLGHRFELAPAALTVSAGPSIVSLEKLGADALVKSRAVRAAGSVRVEPASLRHVHLYVSVDASIDLGTLADSGAVATGLPTWSLGAALGGELVAWP
jgi:hypothetical protein